MPRHSRIASIGDLARVSLRVQALFIVTLSLAIVMVILCYWVVTSLVSLASNDARAHFRQLALNLHGQESFLARATHNEATRLGLAVPSGSPASFELIDSDDITNTYEGQRESLAMPYIIKVGRAQTPAGGDHSRRLQTAAAALSSLFGTYRNAWQQPGMQAFLLDLNSVTSISVPCSEDSMTDDVHRWWRCPLSANRIRELLYTQTPRPSPDGAQWLEVNLPGAGEGRIGYVVYAPIELPDALWIPETPKRQLVLATFTEMRDVLAQDSDYGRVYFQHLAIAPGLTPPHAPSQEHGALETVQSDVRFALDGVYIQTWCEDGWHGTYLVPYQQFFQAAGWQLAAFGLLILLCVGGSPALYRRHRNLIVRPAQASHQRVVESESFNRAVIDAARVAVCALRLSDHQIVAKNQLADAWLGDADTIRRLTLAAHDAAGAGNAEDVQINGRHLSVSASRVTYQGDEVILATFSDISDHKRVQEALAQAKRAADDANAGKTVFLATMSHEIRTPLYGTLGTVELLGLTQLTNLQRAYLRTIQSSSAGLLNVINDILDVSKIESRQMTLKDNRLDPAALTEETLQAYAATADAKGLQFFATIATNVPVSAHGDALRIRQVLNNLISNAIKFTEAGWVRVDLTVADQGEGQAMMEWRIADTGLGIAADQQPMLFQPFYQAYGTGHAAPGTGLGLYICHSLCELMQGSITLDSSPGRGSTFIFRLPLRIDADATRLAGVEIAPAPPVWVRAPMADLAQDTCAWLALAGASARAIQGGALPAKRDGILVELLPERLPPIEWNGARVSCIPDGPDKPQWSLSEIHVTSHMRHSIVEAVAMAQHGRSLASDDADADADDADGTDTRAAAEYRPDAGLRRLGLRVLVAEDNPVNRTLLVRQLEELGCEVTLCVDGVETLARWNADEFDVLITDMNMPLMNGYELVRALRARSTNAPIIGLTANALQAQREAGLAAGLNAWIVKPVDLRTLHDALSTACARIISAKFTVPPQASLEREKSKEFYETQLRAAFNTTMREDMASMREALAARDPAAAVSTLHRMRGSLVVVNADETARFCGVLEQKIAAEGLTPVLENAVRSTLAQLTEKFKEL